MEREDFNQYYTTAIGKGVHSELNSTLICPEVTRCFKVGMREHREGGSEIREVKTYKKGGGVQVRDRGVVRAKQIWGC